MKRKLKVCWISAGISSFMAGYLAGNVDEWIYIDIADQHPDSIRFIKDCEKAVGKEIEILRSKEYSSVEECVKTAGFIGNYRTGIAVCTNWLKKRVRKEWEEQHKDCELTYVWGFDLKEKNRAERTIEANPQANHEFPLLDRQLSKEEVHGLFERTFDFARPRMYELGYPNNNCIGCVKGGMGYWNHIRKDFPEVFESRAKLERQVGYSILKDSKGKPVFLDELDPNRGNMNTEIFPDCGIMCYLNLEPDENIRSTYLDKFRQIVYGMYKQMQNVRFCRCRNSTPERRIYGMRREFLQNMFEANIQEASIVLKKETLTSKDMEDVMSLLNDARKYAWRIKYLVEAEKQH